MLFYGTLTCVCVGAILGCLCAPFIEAAFGLIPDYSRMYAVNTHAGSGIVGCVGFALAVVAMVLLIMIIMAMPTLGYKLPDRPFSKGWGLVGIVCGLAVGITAKMGRNLTIRQDFVAIPLFATMILCLLATGVIFEIPGIIRQRLDKKRSGAD